MRKEFFKFFVLLLVAIGAGPASAAFWQWSQSAANNATADPSINWSEGMSPSSVNDSARAMMAAEARNRDDTSGKLLTAGTATAYTVSTNQGLQTPTPVDGQKLAVTVHATNGVAVTLAADGGTAYPIQSSPGAAAASGAMVLGAPYILKFSEANSAWMLLNFYGQPLVVPLGGMIDYFGASPPNSNFIFPYGQCISRTTYAAFFAMVGTVYGACDGTTTFAVPDLRGRVSPGAELMGGVSSGRLTSTYVSGLGVGGVGGSEAVPLTTAQLPVFTPTVASATHSHTHTYAGPGSGPVSVSAQTADVSVLRYSTAQGDTTGPASTSIVSVTMNPIGAGLNHPNLQPLMLVNKLLRIL